MKRLRFLIWITKVDTTESVVTANEIKALEQVADPVEVPEEASVESVAFEAKHFSTYTVMFYNNNYNYNYTSVSFDFKDTDNGDVGSGSYSLMMFLRIIRNILQKKLLVRY